MKESLPGLVKEQIYRFGLWQFLRISELSPAGQSFFKEVTLPAMIAGKKRWPSEDVEVLLEGFDILIDGFENIPEENLGLVIINHWGAGPLRHYWPDYLMCLQTARKTGKNVRWIFQDALEMKVAGFRLGMEVPLFSQLQRIVIETYQLFDVSAGFKKSAKLEVRVVKMLREFRDGEILGLAPELRSSLQLPPGDPQSGKLVKILAKIKPKTLILAARASSKNDNLFLNIGEPRPILDLVSGDDQETADNLMAEIGKLRTIFGP